MYMHVGDSWMEIQIVLFHVWEYVNIYMCYPIHLTDFMLI